MNDHGAINQSSLQHAENRGKKKYGKSIREFREEMIRTDGEKFEFHSAGFFENRVGGKIVNEGFTECCFVNAMGPEVIEPLISVLA